MELNKNPAKREKEMPMDTPLNPEVMFSIDENEFNYPFTDTQGSDDELKDSEQTGSHSAEENTEHMNGNL